MFVNLHATIKLASKFRALTLERAEIHKNLISVYTGQHKSLSFYNSLQNQFFTPQRVHMIIFCEEKVYNGKQQFTKVS